MRPLVLKMSAFGPYAGETVIPMQELGTRGLYLITGNTGAGKTTIFDAICYVLFGKASGDQKEKRDLRSKYAAPDMPTEVELLFMHNNKEYRVVRNPEYERPSKRGGGFVKQAAGACLYMPDGSTVTKSDDVTAVIETLLGINREQFLQIVMIAQGDFKKLLIADTTQRQNILRNLFKTSFYQQLQSSLDDSKKGISDIVKNGRESINQYISDICVDENDVLALEVDKAKKGELITDDILELLEKLISQDKDLKEKTDKDFERVNKELERINACIGAAETANRAKETIDRAEASLCEVIPREKYLKARFEETKNQLKKKDELTKQIAELDADLDRCSQIEKLNSEIRSVERELSQNSANLLKKDEEKAAAETKLKQLVTESDSVKEVDVSIEKLKNEFEKIKSTKEELDELADAYNNYVKETVLLKKAQETYAKDNADYLELKHISDVKEQAFRDGQAGILAAELADGQKCPVCGSTSHPEKAIMTPEIPSEEELKMSKINAEKAQEKATESSKRAGSIKTSVELKEDGLKKKANRLLSMDVIEELDEQIASKKESVVLKENEIIEEIESVQAKAERKKQLEILIPKTETRIKTIIADISGIKEKQSGMQAIISEKNDQISALKNKLSIATKAEAEEKKKVLENRANTLQDNYNRADEELKEVSKNIVSLKAEIESSKKTLKGAKIIDIETEKNNKEINEHQQSEIINILKAVDSRIDRNESIFNHVKIKSEKIAETEKQLQWVAALADTANGNIKGKERVKLETYIQTTYFERIISRANLRFMEMSGGQYELKRQSVSLDGRIKSGLELEIIDHYNGTERSVKTLSGGESFMASLSLALGLSDEVQSSAGGIQIDTMFVDEGFGSLDTDSLNQAYKALAGLTEGNRLVGIISHVAELKDKIDNQIIVKKEKSGGSFVSIQC